MRRVTYVDGRFLLNWKLVVFGISCLSESNVLICAARYQPATCTDRVYCIMGRCILAFAAGWVEGWTSLAIYVLLSHEDERIMHRDIVYSGLTSNSNQVKASIIRKLMEDIRRHMQAPFSGSEGCVHSIYSGSSGRKSRYRTNNTSRLILNLLYVGLGCYTKEVIYCCDTVFGFGLAIILPSHNIYSFEAIN